MNITAPTWDNLASVFEDGIDWIFVSSPWFSAKGIEKLNTFLPDKKIEKIKNIEIWFRLNIEDHLLGMTDYDSLSGFVKRLYEHFKGNRFRLYASDNLHAKAYASDKRILITSANLTENGFVDNIEIGIDVASSAEIEKAFRSFVKKQRKHLTEVSIKELGNFAGELKSEMIVNCRGEISKILTKARNQMSLLAMEEKSPPHSKFPIR